MKILESTELPLRVLEKLKLDADGLDVVLARGLSLLLITVKKVLQQLMILGFMWKAFT